MAAASVRRFLAKDDRWRALLLIVVILISKAVLVIGEDARIHWWAYMAGATVCVLCGLAVRRLKTWLAPTGGGQG